MKEKKDIVSDAPEKVKGKRRKEELSDAPEKVKGKRQKAELSDAPIDTVRPAVETQNDKYKYIIHNKKVKRGYNRRLLILILLLFLLLTVIFGGAAYGVMSLIEYNNFRIMIDRAGNELLSLSHDEQFKDGGSQTISLNGPRYMDNVTFLDLLPLLPEIEAAGGNYNTEEDHFIAATFFLKNTGNWQQSYTESIIIKDATKGVDAAIRIFVIRNGEGTVYAKAREDGTPEEVVPTQNLYRNAADTETWKCENFFDEGFVLYNNGILMEPGETVKYTVLIWLEGWDEQCLDPIIGGTVRIEMLFTAKEIT